MSHSIHRRGAALFMTAGLAALALASAPAQAADITAQTAFSLSQAGGGKIALGGGSFDLIYTSPWNRTSQNFEPGVRCSGLTCFGSSETLNTNGSMALEIQGSAKISSATMDFTQGTTTNLSGSGNQYAFTTAQTYAKAPTFTTSAPTDTLNEAASLNYTDTLLAKGCFGVCISTNKVLLTEAKNNFQIYGVDTVNSHMWVTNVRLSWNPGQTFDGVFGTYSYDTAKGLSSVGGAQTQATATSTSQIGTTHVNVLEQATYPSTPISSSSPAFDLLGNIIRAVNVDAGSVVVNATEQLIQTATMTVTHAVKTFFRDAKSQAIAVPVHLAGTPDGTYSRVSEVDGDAEFTLGDGMASLAGDQIVTATTYDVAFEEYLGIDITGDMRIQMLSGDVQGDLFGPLYKVDIPLAQSGILLYDHVYHEYFTTYSILTIPGAPLGGVPEPATWALMLLGFGGMGLMLRARGRAALAA